MDMDQQNREPAIDNPEAILTLLLNMKKYVHKMPIRQKGGLVYPQVFFSFMDPLDKIMENIGWWLHSTEQGMWKAQLQQAEETTRLRWLFFSADEFDKDILKAHIWETTALLGNQ